MTLGRIQCTPILSGWNSLCSVWEANNDTAETMNGLYSSHDFAYDFAIVFRYPAYGHRATVRSIIWRHTMLHSENRFNYLKLLTNVSGSQGEPPFCDLEESGVIL